MPSMNALAEIVYLVLRPQPPITDGQTDGQTDGRTEGQTNGRTDGHTKRLIEI